MGESLSKTQPEHPKGMETWAVVQPWEDGHMTARGYSVEMGIKECGKRGLCVLYYGQEYVLLGLIAFH